MLGLGNSITGGAVLSEVAPNEVANLAIWYANATQITSDGGTPDLVGQWRDSSGSSRHITQTTDEDKGTLANGGILMNGADPEDHYEIAAGDGRVDIGGTNPFTLIIAFQRVGTAAIAAGDPPESDPHGIIGGNSDARHIVINTEEQIIFKTTTPNEATSTFNFDTNTWEIGQKIVMAIRKDTSGAFKFFKNGAAISTTSATNPTNTGTFDDMQYFGCRRVGSATSDFTFDGTIFEFILYDADIGTANISDVSLYTANKLGIVI